MKASKKKVVVGGLLAAFALTGCVIAPTVGTSSSVSIESVEIGVDPSISESLKLLIPSGNSNEQTMIEKANEAFNLLYPNVTFDINFVSIPTYESTIRQFNMAGDMPDVIWTNSQEVYFLRSLGAIDPLNQYIEQSEARGDYNFEEDFKTEFFDMAGDNGTYYAVPRSADTVVCFYNKKLLNQAGISMDKIQNGWSWEDFIDLCSQWRSYADKQGHSDWYCCDFNFSWSSVYYPFIRSYGADIFSAKDTVGIDTPEMREGLSAIRQLVDDHYCVGSGVTSGSSFESGTCPFIFQSAAISHYDEMRELKGNIDIVTFPFINGQENAKIGAGVAGYSLCTKSKKKALAWEYLNFLMSYDGQQALATGGLNLPSIRNDLADPDNAEANWTKGYTDRNLEAYVLYDEKKIADEYYAYCDPSAMANVTLAISDIMDNTLSTRENRRSIDDIISRGVSDLNDAVGK